MLKTVNEAGKYLSLKLENEYLNFVFFLFSKILIFFFFFFFFNMLLRLWCSANFILDNELIISKLEYYKKYKLSYFFEVFNG